MSPAAKWIHLLLMWIRDDRVDVVFGESFGNMFPCKGRVVPSDIEPGQFTVQLYAYANAKSAAAFVTK